MKSRRKPMGRLSPHEPGLIAARVGPYCKWISKDDFRP